MAPYAGEHSCRLQNPGKYPKFARKAGKGKQPDMIFGILGPDESEIQAYRYPVKRFSRAEAKGHCRKHKGKFEAASGKVNTVGEVEPEITMADEGGGS